MKWVVKLTTFPNGFRCELPLATVAFARSTQSAFDPLLSLGITLAGWRLSARHLEGMRTNSVSLSLDRAGGYLGDISMSWAGKDLRGRSRT